MPDLESALMYLQGNDCHFRNIKEYGGIICVE